MSIAWFIVITCLICVIQGYIFNKWGLVCLQYTRFFNKESVFAGEEIEMVDEITNNKLLPIPWLRLESKIDSHLQFVRKHDQPIEVISDEFHRTLFSMMPFQKITRRHKVTCTKRGYYELKAVSLTIGDVLGLGESFDRIHAEATIIVYPQMVAIEEIPLPSHSWLGDIIAKRWIIDDPFVIAGVRQYASGDPMNSVNWNATARTGHLQVSKRDFTADHELMIYLNFDETEDIWMPIQHAGLFEKGISYAASIAQLTISKGINTGFGCNSYLVESFREITENNIKESVRIEPKNGKHQLTYILDTMAKLSMDRSMSFNRFLMEDFHTRKQTDILVITSIVTEKLQQNIQLLENQGNKIEVLMLTDDNEHAEQGEGEYIAQ